MSASRPATSDDTSSRLPRWSRYLLISPDSTAAEESLFRLRKMVPRLPPELLDLILANLRPGADWDTPWPRSVHVKHDLRMCSLVSRSWNVLTRRFLFRDLTFSYRRPRQSGEGWWDDVEGKGERWTRIEGLGEPIPCKTFSMLVQFLRDAPHLRRYVRRLSLRCQPGSLWQEFHRGLTITGLSKDWMYGNVVDAPSFAALLGLLPDLSSLNLHDVRLDSSVPVSQFLPTRTSIPELSLFFESETPHISHVLALLDCFDHIGSLQWLRFQRIHDHDPTSYASPSHLGVNTLVLKNIDSVLLLDEIAEVLALNALVLMNPKRPVFNRYNAFIARVAPKLRDVRLSLGKDGKDDDRAIDLAPCVHLRKLVVAVDVFAAVNDDARHRSAARLVAKTLARVYATRMPSALTEFVFEIGAEPAEGFTEDRMEELTRMWAPLDEELIHLAERCDLSSVRFASTNAEQGSFDVLARMFPQVQARKLLTLERAEANTDY